MGGVRLYGIGIRCLLQWVVLSFHFNEYYPGIVANKVSVPGFFILSGIVNAISAKSVPIKHPGKFLIWSIDLVARRWIPLSLWLCVMIGIYYIAGQDSRVGGGGPQTLDFVTHTWKIVRGGDFSQPLPLFAPCPSAWFISTLFFFHLITPLLAWLCFSDSKVVARRSKYADGRVRAKKFRQLMWWTKMLILGVGFLFLDGYFVLMDYWRFFTVPNYVPDYVMGFIIGTVACVAQERREWQPLKDFGSLSQPVMEKFEKSPETVETNQEFQEISIGDSPETIFENSPGPFATISQRSPGDLGIGADGKRLSVRNTVLNVFMSFIGILSGFGIIAALSYRSPLDEAQKIFCCTVLLYILFGTLFCQAALLTRFLDQRFFKRLQGTNGNGYLLPYLLHDPLAWILFKLVVATPSPIFWFAMLPVWFSSVVLDQYLGPSVAAITAMASKGIRKLSSKMD